MLQSPPHTHYGGTVADKDTSLVDSFNSSATDYLSGNLTPGIFANKFQALAKYKMDSDEDKQKITIVLFNTIERYIQKIASPSGATRVNAIDLVQNVSPLLQALASPEALPYLPECVPEALADLAVSLADRVGKVTVKDYSDSAEFYLNDYRTKTTALSALIMEYADHFAQALEQRSAAVKPAASDPRKFQQ